MIAKLLLWMVVLWLVGGASAHAQSPVLEQVRARGELHCGVNIALAGFSMADSRGVWRGLDVDYCRALAAAVLGDANKVRYVALGAQQRFTALQSGEVDVLARNTTWSLSRDSGLGISFVGTLFYDGQGFLVPKIHEIKRLEDLEGASICVQSGTTTELNLADTFRARGISFIPVVFEGFEESIAAFFADRCDAYTTDASSLAVIRVENATNPEAYELLPELISKEPLGPAVAQGDAMWFNIARWVLFGLIEAEERGIAQGNVGDLLKSSADPAVRRLLGVTPGIGEGLRLNDTWLRDVIVQVGNYNDIYQRNIGTASTLNVPRSFNNCINKLWQDGGLHYAPPLR